MITELARDTPPWRKLLRMVDSTPVPAGTSRETVRRSDLAGDAGYGYCASHSRFFWGFRLYLVCTPEGMPIIRALANPKIGEREVTQAVLEHDYHLIRAGQVILGDKGFAGREFEAFITEQLGATLIRPDRKDEKPRFGSFGGIRQWIESVFDTLKGHLGLERHGGRTIAGVYARVGGKLLALAAGIWHNWLIGALRKRSLIAYDHYELIIWAAEQRIWRARVVSAGMPCLNKPVVDRNAIERQQHIEVGDNLCNDTFMHPRPYPASYLCLTIATRRRRERCIS